MKLLLPLIQQAAIGGLIGKKTSLMHMNKFGLSLMALSGLLFLTALFFAVLSVYGWLLSYYAQPVAALIVSGISLTVSFIFGLFGFVLVKKRAAQKREQIAKLMSEISDAIGVELSEPIKDNPKTAMLMASVAGLVAGEHLH